MFYSGVVEDRYDPLMLGRCKVRIVGLHTEDKKVLPTEALPWAIPMQPITSAAMSGIGYSPVGPVEGTWVVVIFRDPEQQIPVMIGSVGGIPQSASTNVYANDDDGILLKNEDFEDVRTLDNHTVVDADGNTLKGGESNPMRTGSGSTTPTNQPTTDLPEQYIGTMTKDQVVLYKDGVARRESKSEPDGEVNYVYTGIVGGQNYGVTNAYGKIGKYQMSGYMLSVIGYVTNVLNSANESTFPSNYKISDDTVWSGKDGIKGVADFLASASTQESAMDEYTKYNYTQLKRMGILNDSMSIKEICGYLNLAHPEGHRRVVSFRNGSDLVDGYGNTSTALFTDGYASQEGDKPKTLPQNVPEGADASDVPIGDKRPDGTISTGSGAPQMGFQDPNAKYPLKDHLNEPDTNRLARNQFIDKTVVGQKDATRELKVPTAIKNVTWNQPESPYNTRYPFNHVFETESGHVMEFDDTPENERVHIYHKKGTFIEMDTNGTQVNKIVGDGYQIIDRNGYVYVKGALNLTVDGVTKIFCRSQADIEVVGDAKLYARNDLTVHVSGNMNLSVLETLNIRCQDFNMHVLGNSTTVVDGKLTLSSGDQMDVTSKTNLNIQGDGDLLIRSGANFSTVAGLSMNMFGNGEVNMASVGNMNIKSEEEMYIGSTMQINIRGSRLRMRGGNGVDITSKGTVAVDGAGLSLLGGTAQTAVFANQAIAGGHAAPLTIANEIAPAGERLTPVNASFEQLSTPPRNISKSQYYESEDDGDPSGFIKQQQDNGTINPNDKPTTAQSAPAAPAKVQSLPVSCEAFANMTEFPMSTKLSDNFFLGDFLPGGGSGYICTASSPHKLVDQAGLTKAAIVCNLKGLATNVLENIIKIVPKSDIIISSGYRQLGLVGAESKTSQHPKGQACDIILKKTPRDRKKHYDLIQTIRATVPHDQLLLEYLSGGSVWIHISWSPSCRSQCFTMNNHSRVSGFGEFQLIV